MADYLNDSPIEDFADDRYGMGPFAKSLAKCFREIQEPVGTTIALHGPWGSGKSSVVNLIKRELATAKDDLRTGRVGANEQCADVQIKDPLLSEKATSRVRRAI